MIRFGDFYINPQIGTLPGHFGFGVTLYWSNNHVAKYVGFTIQVFNLNINMPMGFYKESP